MKSEIEKMSPKEIVIRFFEDGYTIKNYNYVMNCMAENYFDHSSAAARSNADAVCRHSEDSCQTVFRPDSKNAGCIC